MEKLGFNCKSNSMRVMPIHGSPFEKKIYASPAFTKKLSASLVSLNATISISYRANHKEMSAVRRYV